MIIGIDASRANREHKSGTEWYSYYLIKNFAQIDDKNQYILYTDFPLRGGMRDLTTSDAAEDKDGGEPEFDKEGYQVIKSPHNNFKAKVLNWPFSFLWTQGRLSLEMIFKKPDVLFVPAHAMPFIHPRKTVTTIHDVAFERSKELYRNERLGGESRSGLRVVNFLVRLFTFNKYTAHSLDYLRWCTRFALKHAKKIITVSRFTKEEMLDMFKVERDKIKVIYNGFNDSIYKELNDPEGEKRVLDKYGLEKPYVLYVGRLERKKNVPFLMEAFAQARCKNPDFKQNLALIGNAGYGYDEVTYLIKEYDLDPYVFTPGWVEEKDMPYIFNAATAFVFPSRQEGFGIPLLQAFGCGVPVAASCIPPFREVAKGGAALFFNPVDKEEMTQALEKITLDEDLRKVLVQRGKRRAGEFSWRKCARETLQELENIE